MLCGLAIGVPNYGTNSYRLLSEGDINVHAVRRANRLHAKRMIGRLTSCKLHESIRFRCQGYMARY